MIKKEYFSIISTIFGLALSIFGLVQNNNILAITGSIVFILAVIFLFMYLKEKNKHKNINLEIQNRRIESLNFANLTRLTNKSLLIEKAYHTYTIEEQNLVIDFSYKGKCIGDNETGIEFSIDSDIFIPYNKLEIIAYDLINDKKKKQPIMPGLIGKDGNSKKIKLHFFEPLLKNNEFFIELKVNLNGCMNYGYDYVTATLSFYNSPIDKFKTKICFKNNLPEQIDVYRVENNKPIKNKCLKYKQENKTTRCFKDSYDNINAQEIIVYSFKR